MNTPTSSSSVSSALTAAGLSAPIALETVVLTRSQLKALQYAKSLHEKGQLDSLSLSGNKTDKLLADAIRQREAICKAEGNNQKIHAYILHRIGSDTRFAIPKSSKLADLFTWVSECEAQIRGKDDSTEKARQSRANTINERFAKCFDMIENLRTIQTLSAPAAPAAAPVAATAAPVAA